MATVEDLVVQARPEGLDETADGINQMEEGIEESAESMGDASSQMEDLQGRWQGAFGAMVAGLSVAVGGLLSQVPVIQENFAGLGAIAEALLFQVDNLLRSLGVGGLTGILFRIADAIFNLEGPLGSLVGLITIAWTAFIGAAGGAAAWLARLIGFSGIANGLISGLGSIIGSLGTFTTLVLGAAAAIGTALGLFGVAILEVTGLLDAIRNLGQAIGEKLPSWAKDGLTNLLNIFLGPIAVIGSAIAGFVSGVLDGGLSEGIDRAVDNAKQVLDTFVSAWGDTLSRIKSAVTDFISWVGSKFDTEIVGGLSVGDIAGSVGDLAGGVADAGAGGGFRAGRSETPIIQLDGYDVTASTGRWRSDETSRRGRNG